MPSVTSATPATASTVEDHAHGAQQRRIRVARAPEPPEERRGKQRERRAIERHGRRAEDQPESQDAAHARAHRRAGPVNPKTTWNAVTTRHGDDDQRHSAHGARTHPRQRLLQPPTAQVDGDRHGDASRLQQQQQPIGNRARARSRRATASSIVASASRRASAEWAPASARRATIAAGIGTSTSSAS